VPFLGAINGTLLLRLTHEHDAFAVRILRPKLSGDLVLPPPLFEGHQRNLMILDELLDRLYVRIPGDADQRSDLMAIAIPKLCRSRFRDDGDHCSDGKPIRFRRFSEWRSASSESFS